MDPRRIPWLALGALSAGCVQYNSHQNTAAVSVSATVTNVTVNDGASNAAGAQLTSVPDIPSVPGARVDVQTIRNTLDTYGDWVDDPTYGVVWMPSETAVGSDFVPYGSNGRWVPTDQGWYWESRYTWGWLPFHYGRWVLVRQTWAWVPGSLFAPAWVDWRVTGEYVGWAPLPPRGASFMAPYAFCHYGELMEYQVWSYAVYGAAGAMIYAESTSIQATYGVGGAYYAWGPTPSQCGYSTSVVVPITQAWGGETGAARGGSSGGSAGGTTVAQPAQPAPSHGGGGVASPSVPVGRPAPGTGPGSPGSPSTVASSPPRVAGLSPGMPTGANTGGQPNNLPPPPVPGVRPHGSAELAFDPAAYRPRDTVVIRESVPSAPPRQTVSLGTTDAYVPPAYTPSFSQPGAAATYTPPVASGNAGYSPPAATYNPPPVAYNPPPVAYHPPPVAASPSYSPPTAYTPPHAYGAPSVPSYQPPAASPTYASPHVTYSAPPVMHSAPVAPSAPAAAYHPAYVRSR